MMRLESGIFHLVGKIEQLLWAVCSVLNESVPSMILFHSSVNPNPNENSALYFAYSSHEFIYVLFPPFHCSECIGKDHRRGAFNVIMLLESLCILNTAVLRR